MTVIEARIEGAERGDPGGGLGGRGGAGDGGAAATRPALALLATELCRVVPLAITATAPVTASTVPTSTRLVTRLALVAVVTVELRPIKPPTEPDAVAETVSRPDCWARLPDTVRLAAVIVTFFVEAATARRHLGVGDGGTDGGGAGIDALCPGAGPRAARWRGC